MAIGFTDRSFLQPDTVFERNKPITVVVELVKSTAAAILVRDGSGSEAWLPRKSITIEDGIRSLRVTMPTWLAIDKGLRTDVAAGQKTLF